MTAGGNDKAAVRVSKSDDIGMTLGIIDKPHVRQGPRGQNGCQVPECGGFARARPADKPDEFVAALLD